MTGWWFEPLWKIWVRQLGWLATQYFWENKSHGNQLPPTSLLSIHITSISSLQSAPQRLCARLADQGFAGDAFPQGRLGTWHQGVTRGESRAGFRNPGEKKAMGAMGMWKMKVFYGISSDIKGLWMDINGLWLVCWWFYGCGLLMDVKSMVY